jgi:hypothetical protein
MAEIPLVSTFATGGAVDTNLTLNGGSVASKTTTLTVELSDSETEVMYIDDPAACPCQGIAIIENETLWYQRRLGPDGITTGHRLLDLIRAQNGTPASTHSVGTVVELHPLYYVPQAIIDALIALQTRVVALELP